jgi:hypothetical protein
MLPLNAYKRYKKQSNNNKFFHVYLISALIFSVVLTCIIINQIYTESIKLIPPKNDLKNYDKISHQEEKIIKILTQNNLSVKECINLTNKFKNSLKYRGILINSFFKLKNYSPKNIVIKTISFKDEKRKTFFTGEINIKDLPTFIINMKNKKIEIISLKEIKNKQKSEKKIEFVVSIHEG